MTVDIAQLGVEIQTADIARGRRELDRFTESGARAERATQTLERSALGLGRAVASVTAGLGIAQIVRYADAYQGVNARLRLVTSSQEQYAFLQGRLNALADDTRNSLTGTIDLYSRIARSTKSLVASDNDRLKVTKAISQALIVSGASGASAEAALVQLGQGFASGTLRGEELNSVMEQTPRLAQAIADGLGITIGQLRAYGQQGRLTAEQVFGALKSQAGLIDSEFRQIPASIGQSLQVAENRIQRFIGEQSQASGAGKALAGTIDTLSRNIDALAAAALGFGAAKLAQVLLTNAAAARVSITAALEHTAAIAAQRTANIAAAQAAVAAATAQVGATQADVAAAAAKVQEIRATEAAIVSARAETIAKLQSTQATIAQSQAQILAARSAGALSFALAAQREGTNALVAAQARQAALTTELAVLGQQQARVQGSLAAAQAAQTAASGGAIAAASALAAAQRGVVTATAAAGTAMTVARGVLAALGGPIGVVTTLIGLGATAWLLYGNRAKEAGDKAKEAIEGVRSVLSQDQRDLGNLDALIGRLKGSGNQQDAERVQRLERRRAALLARIENERRELRGLQDEQRGQQLLSERYVTRRQDDELLKQRQREALAAFLENNQTKAEKFAAAISKAKAEMGEFFNADVEKRIRADIFGEGPKTTPYATEVANQREKLALLVTELEQKRQVNELDKVTAEIAAGKYGKLKAAQEGVLTANAREIDQKQEQVRLLAEEAQYRERVSAFLAKAEQQALAEVEKIVEQNQALRDEIELMGATEAGKAAVEKARVRSIRTLKEEQLAMRQNAGESDEQLILLRQEIELLKEREELIGRRASLAEGIALRDGAAKAGDTYRDTLADSIEQGILDGSRKGLDLMEIFRQELVAQFSRTILRPIIQPLADAGNSLIGDILGTVGSAIFGGSGLSIDTSVAGNTGGITSDTILPGSLRGGRASGGPTSAGGMYEVAEDGPELYREGGRTYLLSGRDGMVTPARQAPQPQGGDVVVNTEIRVINNGEPRKVERETRRREGNREIIEIFLAEVAQDVRSGGQIAQAGEQRYGWNAGVGAG